MRMLSIKHTSGRSLRVRCTRAFALALLIFGALGGASLPATSAAPAAISVVHLPFIATGPSGRIVFETNRDGNVELYLLDVASQATIRLTNNTLTDSEAAWSPNGTKIAYISNDFRTEQIYVMNADGSGQTNLTQNVGRNIAPVFSPDGTKIAFYSNRAGNFEVFVM